jgi:hypothetical protein
MRNKMMEETNVKFTFLEFCWKFKEEFGDNCDLVVLEQTYAEISTNSKILTFYLKIVRVN